GLAGPDQLHDAVPGSALFAAQRVRAPCPGTRAFRGLAGLHPECPSSLHHSGDRARLQGNGHSVRTASHRQAARDSSRHRSGRGCGPDHAGRDGTGRPLRARRFPGRTAMSPGSFDSIAAVLLIPNVSAALLAVLPGYRLPARLNVVASFATFLAALSLFVVDRPPPGPYVLVDDLNIVFIVLNTFVGFTTSIFSASYIAHELETGRLT